MSARDTLEFISCDDTDCELESRAEATERRSRAILAAPHPRTSHD